MCLTICSCFHGLVSNPQYMYIASVVATYWVVSISLVYLNKILVSNDALSISAPLFVTWFQCIVTVLICWAAGKCGEMATKNSENEYTRVSQTEGDEEQNGNSSSSPSKPKNSSFFEQFPKAQYDWSTAKRIMPLSVIFVGMMTFNNLCLKYVQVSFYNVARSLTIVFNVALTRLLLGIPTSMTTIACLGIVIFGFFLGSNGEVDFSLFGTAMGICSSLFVSLNSIYTKKVLPMVQDNHWRLTFYNNVNACLLFIPLLIFFEGPVLREQLSLNEDSKFVSGFFWMAMIVAGVFGFSIGIVTVLQIKATSPLSHTISGTAKAAAQSMLAFYLWGNQATVAGILGIFTVLGGSLSYTLVKMKENKKQQQVMEPKESEVEEVESAVPVAKEAEMAKV